MTTKHDVGDEVYLNAIVESIEVTKWGVNYQLRLRTSGDNTLTNWFKEDSIHSMIVSKKEDASNAKT